MRIRKLHIEGDRHELEGIFLMQVTELLHDIQQVVLLRQQLMGFKVVDHLAALLVVWDLDALLLFERADAGVGVYLPGGSEIARLCLLHVSQTRKFDSVRERLPFKVEH